MIMTHYLRCKRCGRSLTDPNSQLLGYGPYCFKKLQEDSGIQVDLFAFVLLEKEENKNINTI